MPRFIPDTLRVRNSAKASYDRTGYFYIADTLEVRFEVDGVLTAGTTTPAGGWREGTRFIYNGVTSDDISTIVEPSGSSITANDILEYTPQGWVAVWSSKGLTSTTTSNPYSSIGTLVYSKDSENLLVFTGSEWKEVQPGSSLRVLTTGYTGENIATLNVFGHTGSKNLVFSSEGTDGTASVEVNSPFSSKYFFGPSAPNRSTIPLNFGDRWYNSELGSELVWIPNLPSSAFEFVLGATFAGAPGGGKFQFGTSNVSFIGQDGKSYVLPQAEFDEFIAGNYDLSLYDSLTGAWVMIPIAGGGGTGSLSSIEVDGTSYSDVSSLVFNSGTNTTLESSLDASSLTITFGVNISEVVGATGSTGATGATGTVGTISAGGNSVTDAQFLSFEDGGIITVSSLTSDSGITVTYSASLVGATGIYVNGSTIGLSANIEDLNDVSSVIIGTFVYGSGQLPPTGFTGQYILQYESSNQSDDYAILLRWDGSEWEDITSSSFVKDYFYDKDTSQYYWFFEFSEGTLGYSDVTANFSKAKGLFYDSSNEKYIIKTFELDDISDVTASSPTDGYFLKYNSSTGKWEPGAPPTSSGGTTGIDISVAGTTYEDQEVLAFTGQNGSNGIPLTQVSRSEFQGSTGSLISIELTGAAHSSFSDNRFVSNTSSQGNAKKVLTINEDGTIGWEYIRNYDVVDPNKFNFSVSTFGFDSNQTDYFSTHTIIVEASGTTFIASDNYSLSATYNGDVSDKLFKITTSNANLDQYYNNAPNTYLTGLYPNGISGYNGTWSIKYPFKLTGYNGSSSTLGDVGRTQLVTQITATGSFEGGTETVSTRTVTFKFDNYVYGGYTSANLVTSNNTLDIDSNILSNWLNTNPSTVYRGTYFTNSASIDQDLTPSQLDAEEDNYSFVLWPERLGWQTPRLAQDGDCLDSIFPTAGDASVVQSAFHALGITLENEFGFEERYNIYQFPNPGQNFSGLRITLTGNNPC